MVEHIDVGRECLLEWFDVADQRINGVGELGDVPLADVGLGTEAVALELSVGGVWGPTWVVVLEPAVRAVVDRETMDRHVVGVHNAVDEPDALPVDDHVGGAAGDFGKPSHVVVGGESRGPAVGDVGEVQADRVVGERSEEVAVVARHWELEVTEANERRCYAADDRALLPLGVTVVEHVAHHVVAGGGEAERSRGRYAEVEHRFAAEELAHRASQDGKTVGVAAVGRWSGPLELQCVAHAGVGDDLAERNRTAVT